MAYPVPASGTKMYFRYPVQAPATVRIDVVNLIGEKIITLAEDKSLAGEALTAWDISHVAPGVYLYRVQITDPQGQRTLPWKKLIVIKK